MDVHPPKYDIIGPWPHQECLMSAVLFPVDVDLLVVFEQTKSECLEQFLSTEPISPYPRDKETWLEQLVTSEPLSVAIRPPMCTDPCNDM